MQKDREQLQAALGREIEYSKKLNEKIDRLREQLKNSISKSEHEKIVADYERKLSEIKLLKSVLQNERGAGRKRIVSKELAAKVLDLSGQGLSQAKIAAKLFDEFNIKIGRTTVGEIVRGNYALPDER